MKKNRRMKPSFVLDCCNTLKNRIPQYDDFNDKYLIGFFEKPSYKNHIERIKSLHKPVIIKTKTQSVFSFF